MDNYKCPQCKSEIHFDANCEVDEGVGHYYCENDKCNIHDTNGTIKVYFPTGETYTTG